MVWVHLKSLESVLRERFVLYIWLQNSCHKFLSGFVAVACGVYLGVQVLQSGCMLSRSEADCELAKFFKCHICEFGLLIFFFTDTSVFDANSDRLQITFCILNTLTWSCPVKRLVFLFFLSLLLLWCLSLSVLNVY